MKRNVGQTPRRVRGIPFVENVIVDDLPTSFRSVTFEYDGTTDPWDHICRFENTSFLHCYSDGVKCRVFATTLTNYVQNWFSQLGDEVIHGFEQLTALFMLRFASSRKQL